MCSGKFILNFDRLLFQLRGTDFSFNENTTGCYFYDKILRDWSREGCEAIWSDDVIAEGRIVCHCDHLTNFAVIVVCELLT